MPCLHFVYQIGKLCILQIKRLRGTRVSGTLMRGTHVSGTHTWGAHGSFTLMRGTHGSDTTMRGTHVSDTFMLHIIVPDMRTERENTLVEYIGVLMLHVRL